MPCVYLALGGVILVAEAIAGEARSGLGWFAVMAGIAAFYAFGGRFEWVRQARGDFEDERDASINRRAMSATGTALVIVLIACIVVQLARGQDPSPYSILMSIGGVTYVASLFFFRYHA
jgi:hypothetical protein